jgi:hypothetical protein
LYSGFLRPEKIQRPQSDLNPQTLDLEASTLPETEFSIVDKLFLETTFINNDIVRCVV